MKIVNRNPADLIPAEYNPRTLTQEQFQQIKASIQRLGFIDPVIVNKHPERLDILVGGHQRTRVAIEMGLKTIPTVEVNMTPEMEKEANIRLNKNVGGWDYDTLANMFDQADLEEWGFTDFDFGQFDGFDEDGEGGSAQEDDFDTTPPEKPKTVLGDLYEIGEHRLLCGSSTEINTWEKVMSGDLCDLVVTDPPYNVDYTGKTKDSLKIENDKKSNDGFYQFLYDFYTALAAYTKKGGAWYVWHADSEGANFRQAMKDAGIMVKQCLIWVKNSMVMGRQDYHWKHEPCLYGWKEGAAHNWYTDRKQTTVLEFDRPTRSGEHPTMKPIPLISYQIGNSSSKGDIVSDAFLGSGSTMVAAHQLKRKCYGMELDPKYCDVIVNRMLNLDDTLIVKRNGKDVTKEWK